MTRGRILAEKVMLRAKELVRAERPDLEAIANDNSAKGLGRSGATVLQRYERRFRTLEELLAERMSLETDYPLAPEDEGHWYGDLLESIMLILHDQKARILRELEEDGRRVGISRSLTETANEQFNQTSYIYLKKAEIMKADREHRKKIPPSSPTQSIVLNINHSQIAGLNVGGVVGTIQASVSDLQTLGAEKLAEALKALAEAIAAEGSFDANAKRASLEFVSGIGEELAKPEGDRRPSVLRAMGAGLFGLIQHVDKLHSGYELLKAAARANGLELP